MQHLLHWKDWDSQSVHYLLEKALDIKQKPENYTQSLQGKNVLLLFEKTSTRTRISFEVGIHQLGGNAIFMDSNHSQIQKTKLSYEIGSLCGYCDFILARLNRHDDLVTASKASTVPIINGCCNLYHPCQALADLLTMKEQKKDLKKVKLVYVGVHNNVVNSLVSMANHFQFQLCLVCPLSPSGSVDQAEKQKAHRANLLVETLKFSLALENADFIYTDTWVDMEFFLDTSKRSMLAERKRIMMPYQLNRENLGDSKAKIMHDMPIHDGYEITNELVYAENSIIFEQSKNRLYAQKAILDYLNNYKN